MEIDEMLHELHQVVNTPDDEIMVLPFGNSDPKYVLEWLLNLNDEDFSTLMKTPIIHQAKAYYRQLRYKMRGE